MLCLGFRACTLHAFAPLLDGAVRPRLAQYLSLAIVGVGGGGVEAVDEVVRGVLRGAGAAAGVPDGRALQEHLLAVAERLAALGAASAGRMKVVVIARLEHLDKINKTYKA